MFKQVILATGLIGLSASMVRAEPAQTMITGRSNLKSVYETSYTGPMRTTLTLENKFPVSGAGEVLGSFSHAELNDLEQDIFGVGARYGLGENITIGASLPVIDSEFNGKSNTGLGDLELSAALLAFQDIFRYPFIIPHLDVSLPTGDEDKGLGAGESVINFGISVGTKVYDALTYVVDFSYAFNGAGMFIYDNDENIFMVSGSIVWDISDRLAVVAEGRFYEELDEMEDNPFEVRGGLAYRASLNTQVAAYGGVIDGGFGEDYDTATVQVTVGF